MNHPTILYEAAKLHHKEIQMEMASWQMANRAKRLKRKSPKPRKRFVMLSFSSNKNNRIEKLEEVFSR